MEVGAAIKLFLILQYPTNSYIPYVNNKTKNFVEILMYAATQEWSR